MIDGVSVRLSEATESSVRVTLVASDDVDLSGAWELYGPLCEYARTLASAFRGRVTEAGDVEFLVTEPCYWSPAMPFLYELRRTDSLADGETHSFGLRQLIVHGRNLRLGRERIVLRGAIGSSFDVDEIQQAHSAECALALGAWAQTALETASRYGTTLLLEADEFINLPSLIEEASWNPAVAGVVLDGQLLTQANARTAAASGIILAQKFNSQNWGDVDSLSAKAFLIVATLLPDDRPPHWMAACRRPVIAIRRYETYANFQHARIACDNLQAQLAPEFDLAGYFVEDQSRPSRIY